MIKGAAVLFSVSRGRMIPGRLIEEAGRQNQTKWGNYHLSVTHDFRMAVLDDNCPSSGFIQKRIESTRKEINTYLLYLCIISWTFLFDDDWLLKKEKFCTTGALEVFFCFLLSHWPGYNQEESLFMCQLLQSLSSGPYI